MSSGDEGGNGEALQRALEDCHREKRMLELTLENISDAVLVVDDDEAFVYVCPNVNNIFGYDEAAVRAMGRLSRLLGDDLYDATELEARGEIRNIERQITDEAGRPHDLLVSVKRARIEEGTVLIVCRDVTDLREAESALRSTRERLFHSQKLEALGQLAAGTAHDFNNLLMAIGSFGESIADSVEEGHPSRGDVGEILSAVRRGAALTDQLLAFSRREPLVPRPVKVAALVRGLHKMLERLVASRVTLEVTIQSGKAEARVVPGMLEQVVVNLVVNARDAMPQGGTIEIRSTERSLANEEPAVHGPIPAGDYVIVEVIDDGVGMSGSTLERIFEPFFTTKPAGHGTGLGLPTCYGIVEQAGGHFRVASEKGQGTTFGVYLPRVVDDASSSLRPDLGLS